MWQHRDIVLGVFTFEDLLDAHEILDTRAENEAQYRMWKAAQGDS